MTSICSRLCCLRPDKTGWMAKSMVWVACLVLCLTPCLVLPHLVSFRLVSFCLSLPWLDLSCLILSCLIFSCRVLSCLALPCLVYSAYPTISCRVISCRILSRHQLAFINDRLQETTCQILETIFQILGFQQTSPHLDHLLFFPCTVLFRITKPIVCRLNASFYSPLRKITDNRI